MESEDIRDKLKKQREKWLRERELYKDKEGNIFISNTIIEIVKEINTSS